MNDKTGIKDIPLRVNITQAMEDDLEVVRHHISIKHGELLSKALATRMVLKAGIEAIMKETTKSKP